MIGNLYVKYASEDDAEKAVAQLRGRYYAGDYCFSRVQGPKSTSFALHVSNFSSGRMIEVEFSPVTDFREARCRQFVDGQCTRKFLFLIVFEVRFSWCYA